MDLIKKSILLLVLLKFMIFNSQMFGVSKPEIKQESDNIEFKKNNINDIFNNYPITKRNGIIVSFEKEINKSDIELVVLKRMLYVCLGIFLFIFVQRGYYYVIKDRIKQESAPMVDLLDKDPIKCGLSSDLERILLKKIHSFESSEKFLKKNITLSYLSHLFNTNPKYLSIFIKLHRERSFNNYINYLRIHYITHKLCENPVYREYKISYLAEECGYASPQVFISAFRKEMGMTPISFINNLKNEIAISHT